MILILTGLLLTAGMAMGNGNKVVSPPATQTISLAELEDKVRGGWAGQMIGVTYGAPTEFRSSRGSTTSRATGSRRNWRGRSTRTTSTWR